MNEYFFEVTQVLKKEIRVFSFDETDAEYIIKNRFDNGEILLNQDDCIQSTIKLIKSDEQDQPSLFD